MAPARSLAEPLVREHGVRHPPRPDRAAESVRDQAMLQRLDAAAASALPEDTPAMHSIACRFEALISV